MSCNDIVLLRRRDEPINQDGPADTRQKSFIDVFYHQIRNGIQGCTTRAPPLSRGGRGRTGDQTMASPMSRHQLWSGLELFATPGPVQEDWHQAVSNNDKKVGWKGGNYWNKHHPIPKLVSCLMQHRCSSAILFAGPFRWALPNRALWSVEWK